ncbi:cilia- and flagella-associated protein 221-like [Watersipora subatra]|uniref:cilia- and flagella-associated protein 221-like n=1 Tax=Watersipora subatra TaxID=2589382 RepID=UPI00355AE5ED
MAAPKAATFLETFQFVDNTSAPRPPVPNHILSSKIYAKVQQNAAVKATPSVLNFEGIEVGKTVHKVISLCNVAREVVRLHIIPPQTSQFSIKYTKCERLVPGMTMNCIVEFHPDDYRYYYDAIRIHCPGEDNLVIPIHAYPIMDTSEFPAQLKFPLTNIGQRRTHTFTLSCRVPVDFEFQLTKVQDDEAFTVTPLQGLVPANGFITVFIHYEPISYSTSIMRLQLDVSQFNSKPITCTITGYCQPGINAVKDVSEELSQKRVSSPLERSRQKKMSNRKSSKSLSKELAVKEKKIVDGIRIPERIETVHHVSNMLIQTPGKMTLKELIEAEKSVSGRQMKENRFEQAVRKNVYEERQNQLRWQVKLGETAMTAQDRSKILGEREHAWSNYKELRGDPTPADEKQRTETDSAWRRTIRHSTQLAEEGVQFDLYSNNPWSTRHNATDRFTQAARKIILRNRATKNLRQLNGFLKNWNKKQELLSGDGNMGDSDAEDEEAADPLANKLRPRLSSAKVVHAKYPFFVPPNKKDEMAPDALNEVVTYETDVDLVMKTPFFSLQVPAQSKLLGYNNHEIHLGYDYVEPVLARTLRTGAKEEIINLVKAHEAAATRDEVIQDMAANTVTQASGSKVPELRIEDLEKHEMEDNVACVNLSPPDAMFKPIDYPPLHIFNATPGLQVFQSPAPYGEVDTDYHLCPLPKYTVHAADFSQNKATQKQYLEREDVIKGTMLWKKFPSQGLTSLANTPTLSNVWVPRWTEPFSENLLPLEVPSLQSELAKEDILEYGDSNEGEEGIELTPEMVMAQFDMLPVNTQSSLTDDKQASSDTFPHGTKLPSTNLPVSTSGPVPRQQRERELDQFLSKRSNRLGQRISAKMAQLNSITRDDLIFE